MNIALLRLMGFIYIVVCFLVVSSCSTGGDAAGSESAPDKISEMIDVDCFFDGGSVLVEFKSSDGSVWMVWYNRGISDEFDENSYGVLSVRRAFDKLGREDSEPFIRLEKGSVAERRVVRLLEIYMSSTGSKHENAYMIDDFLKEISVRGKEGAVKSNEEVDAASWGPGALPWEKEGWKPEEGPEEGVIAPR